MTLNKNFYLYINYVGKKESTYDHRVWKTGLPVRSAVLKPHAGRLVVGWVTTSESLLLYVFDPFLPSHFFAALSDYPPLQRSVGELYDAFGGN